MPTSTSGKKLGRVIFVRHGESIWNVTDPRRGLVTRFTGWADIPLTDKGILQARAVGTCLDAFGIKPNAIYTSLLKRAVQTFEAIRSASTENLLKDSTVIRSWRMNERHYGALMGLSKEQAQKKWGPIVMEWRRSWSAIPPKCNREDLREFKQVVWAQPITIISEPGKQNIVATEKGVEVPESESLEDCFNRVLPLWNNGIGPRILKGETVLVVGHANSIRAMIKYIEGDSVSLENIRDIHIPSAIPLVYNFQSTLCPLTSGVNIVPLGHPSPLGMRGKYIVSKEILSLHDNDDSIAKNELDVNSKQQESAFFDLVGKRIEEVMQYCHEGPGKEEAIIITDESGVIVNTNEAWSLLCGFSLKEIEGKTCAFLQGPLSAKEKIKEINEKVHIGLPVNMEIINYRKRGTAFENKITIIPVYNNRDVNAMESSMSTPSFSGVQSFDVDTDSGNKTRAQEDGGVIYPSYFVAKLEVTPDQLHLAPLSDDQIILRDKN